MNSRGLESKIKRKLLRAFENTLAILFLAKHCCSKQLLQDSSLNKWHEKEKSMTLYQQPFKMYPGSQTNLRGRKGLWGEGAAGAVVQAGFFPCWPLV